MIALNGLLSSLFIQGCILKPVGKDTQWDVTPLCSLLHATVLFVDWVCPFWFSVPPVCVYTWQRWSGLVPIKPWMKYCAFSWSCSTGNARAGGLPVCLMCQHSSAEVSSSPGGCHQPLHVCSNLLTVTGNESCLLQDVWEALVWIFIPHLQAGISNIQMSYVRCNFTTLNWEFCLLLYSQ